MKASKKLKIDFYGNSNVPVFDARNGKETRKEIKAVIKASNGKTSKFIPNRNQSRY